MYLPLCARPARAGGVRADEGAFYLVSTITSRENETVKYACKLGQNTAFRQSENRFLAEGLKLCMDLAGTLAPALVFYTQKALGAHAQIGQLPGVHYLVNDAVAAKLSGTKTPQGLFCVFEKPVYTLNAAISHRRVLCLENVQDPANVGALLRSAAAFGFTAALLSPGCADPYGGKALRASMGAVGRLCVVTNEEMPQALQTLRAQGTVVLAAALRRSVPLAQIDVRASMRVALVIGNEGAGLTQETIAAATQSVRIPITGAVESLNAAVAGSVLLWHFREVQDADGQG